MLALSLLAACGSKNDNPPASDAITQVPDNSNVPLSETTPGNPAPNFNANSNISVVTREEGSGTRDAVRDLFDIKDADGKENVTPEAIVQDSTGNLMTSVANNPYAIGYCSLASLNDTVKALDIDGVAATSANVKNGSYKIQRPFYLATMGEANGLAKDFIEFILSAEGQQAAIKRCIPIDDNAPAYSGGAPAGRIVVGGSSSVSPVMEDLIAAYKAINPNAEIELQTSDSSKGMSDAKSGAYDIGMASRKLKDTEIDDGLVPIYIAIDGIAVIVNSGNPISAMTSEQVKNIYNGGIANWNGVQ
jgi:phosphate transport system substrate-binding protein